MFTLKYIFITITLAVTLVGCQTAPVAEPGSKEEAVNKAWDNYCSAGYCEGHNGSIAGRTEDTLTVIINGNTRHIMYKVNGSPGNYQVDMHAK